MIIELIILFEIVAFVFLILSLLPFKQDKDAEKSPFVNKIVTSLIAFIIFASLGLSLVQYDYTYCYINQTSVDYVSNRTISEATCAEYHIESLGLSRLNWGMGIVSFLIAIMMIIFTITYKVDILKRE